MSIFFKGIWASQQAPSPGSVDGPASSTLNAVSRYADTSGKLLKDSGIIISDTDDVIIPGNLNVLGVTTYIESTILQVLDKNIELAKVATPTDITADGGGITVLGATNKTLIWNNTTGAWEFNQKIRTGNLEFDTNTIRSTDTDGNILLLPNGVGNVGIGTNSPDALLDIEVVDTKNATGLKVSQLDVTNNPTGLDVVNAGTGSSLRVTHNAATGIAANIISNSTTARIVTISGTSLTTGQAIAATDADALTTGSLLWLKSNSADTNTRLLVQVHNDNPLAVGAIPMHLTQDSISAALIVLKNSSGVAVQIGVSNPDDLDTAAINTQVSNDNARTTGLTVGHRIEIATNVGDTSGHIYLGLVIDDILDDGASQKGAILTGLGWGACFISGSGDMFFDDYEPTIGAESSGDFNQNGFAINFKGGDGFDSGAVDRDGGNIRLFGGDKANSGVVGNVILAHTGTLARGRVGIGTATPTEVLEVNGNVKANNLKTHTLIENRAPVESTVSDAFVTLASSAATTFSGRPVLCFVNVPMFPSVANTGVILAIQIDSGSDAEAARILLQETEHTSLSGQVIITPPAGSHTINLRWRRNGGTGTLTLDTNDQILLHAIEL
ncbi:MAG TPA: hypothetical protein ENI05_08885 [Porticoccus sp.]|nr:hypothetical protein [Porticoccus sp.]